MTDSMMAKPFAIKSKRIKGEMQKKLSCAKCGIVWSEMPQRAILVIFFWGSCFLSSGLLSFESVLS